MPQSDPRLPLKCASGSTASVDEPNEVFQPGADVHHYACTNRRCGRFWKFGRGTALIDDPSRLAEVRNGVPH
jgi:hypothetical protein